VNLRIKSVFFEGEFFLSGYYDSIDKPEEHEALKGGGQYVELLSCRTKPKFNYNVWEFI